MKFSWLIVASLMFSGNVFADDEKAKADEQSKPKVETNATATVTVVVVDEDGKVITKTISESSDDKEGNVKVEALEGKKVIEITLPDGTKKKVNIGAAEANATTGRVMRWVFRKDGEDAADLDKMSEVKERVEKMLKSIDVDVNIDAENIAEQVEAAMLKVKPLVPGERIIDGEMLFELSDSVFLVQEDEAGVEDDGQKPPRKRIQVRRLGPQDSGLAAVMKKLEEMTKRLEKIEARLDELSKE